MQCRTCVGSGRDPECHTLNGRSCKTCKGTGRVQRMIDDDGSAVPTNLPDVSTTMPSTMTCERCKKHITSGIIFESKMFHNDCYEEIERAQHDWFHKKYGR